MDSLEWIGEQNEFEAIRDQDMGIQILIDKGSNHMG